MPHKDKQKEKEWYEKHREHLKDYKKEYWKNNKERLKEKNNKYQKNNKESIKKNKDKYYQKNKEHFIKQSRENYKNNKENIKKYSRDYYKNNKEKINKQIKEYRNKDPKKWKEYLKEYNKNNRKQLNQYLRNKRKNDKNFNIKVRLRNILGIALRNYTKTGKIWSSSKYGINYLKIIEHLKPFPEDISLYHIDHIKPLCSFDLTNPEEIKKAFAPENHQWLLAFENRFKGGRYLD